jgi:hypothetical protein
LGSIGNGGKFLIGNGFDWQNSSPLKNGNWFQKKTCEPGKTLHYRDGQLSEKALFHRDVTIQHIFKSPEFKIINTREFLRGFHGFVSIAVAPANPSKGIKNES